MIKNYKEAIDNRDDLLAEKERLKNSIRERKASMTGSLSAMRDELNPFSSFSKGKKGESAGRNFLSNVGSSPLVSMGVSSAANFLLRKILLKKVGFLPRLVLPLVVKKASEFIVAPKLNEKLVSGMHAVADKVRETNVEDVVPDAKALVPEKALAAVAKTGDKIAEKLYDAAEKIRPDEKPETLYTPALLKRNPKKKIAKKLHKLADKIRG